MRESNLKPIIQSVDPPIFLSIRICEIMCPVVSPDETVTNTGNRL